MVKRLNKPFGLFTEHSRFFYGFVLVVSFLILSACSSRHAPEGVFDNYLYRLHNSLEIDGKKLTVGPAVTRTIKVLPRYPKRSLLLYTLKESKINLLEFLRLSQCDLQRHIGERNSSLGKLQKDSQRLIYDIEFIRLAELCIESLALDNPLREVLQKASVDKQQQLPLLLWNATFASEEFAHLFSLSANYLSTEKPVQKPTALYEALASIKRMVVEDKSLGELNQSDFENALAVLASRKYLGEVRRSMVLLKEALAHADTLLQQRVEQKPLCRNNAPNAQFEIVNNVFRKFYIGEVQPYIASVYQQSQAGLKHLDTLTKVQTTPEHYEKFWASVYTGNNSEWQQLQQAIELHTKNWQALLKQCGSLPQV